MSYPMHPIDDPHFQADTDEPVWYMAHPIATDERYTYLNNLQHVLHMMRLFIDEGVRVIAPYHTVLLVLDDTNAEHRRIGMEIDLAVVRALKRVVAVGHRVSRGCQAEFDACIEANGLTVDCTGMSDEDLRHFIRNGGVFRPAPREETTL